MIIGLLGGILSLGGYFAFVEDINWGHLFLILICGTGVGIVIGLLISNALYPCPKGVKPESEGLDFPSVNQLRSQGWNSGNE